jgi:hypothetical protein
MGGSEEIRLLTEIRDAVRRTLEIQETMAERQRRVVRLYLVVLALGGAILAITLPLFGYLIMTLT